MICVSALFASEFLADATRPSIRILIQRLFPLEQSKNFTVSVGELKLPLENLNIPLGYLACMARKRTFYCKRFSRDWYRLCQPSRAAVHSIWRGSDRPPAALHPAPCAGASVLPLAEIVLSVVWVLRSYHTSNLSALFERIKRWTWFVKTNNPAPITLWKIFLRLFWNPAAAALWKRALTAKIPWIWKSRGSKPLPSVISSMELPKNFENKKLPNPLRWLAFPPFHL